MHHSRIGVVLIDHPVETYESAASFWAGATGTERAGPLSDDDPYESLTELGGGLHLEAQRTGSGTPARIHLDIETDDVSAEVARVVALGARVVERRQSYVILTDPGGLVFCVVGVQTDADAFAAGARRWE